MQTAGEAEEMEGESGEAKGVARRRRGRTWIGRYWPPSGKQAPTRGRRVIPVASQPLPSPSRSPGSLLIDPGSGSRLGLRRNAFPAPSLTSFRPARRLPTPSVVGVPLPIMKGFKMKVSQVRVRVIARLLILSSPFH